MEKIKNQIAYIFLLKKEIQDLSTHSKKNINITKATKVIIKKIKLVANQVAVIISIILSLSSPLSLANIFKNNEKLVQINNKSFNTRNKTNLYLILDLV